VTCRFQSPVAVGSGSVERKKKTHTKDYAVDQPTTQFNKRRSILINQSSKRKVDVVYTIDIN